MTNEPFQPNVVAAGSTGRFSLEFWLLVIVVGAAAGLAGGLLMLFLRVVQHLAWHYQSGEFLTAVQHSGSLYRVIVLAAAGLIAGVAAWQLNHRPGGHAGELTQALWFRNGDLPFGRTVFRALLSIVLVGMGASLGREAAPKQAGAAIASLLARWRALPPTLCRLLVACGAGAGIGAVYNVPFGGALFGLEVLLGTLKLPLVAPMVVASALATCTSWLLLPNQPTYTVPAFQLTASQVVWAAIAGPIAGLAAVAYVRAISWADRRRPRDRWLLLAPLIIFTLLGLLAVPLPQVLGNGRGIVQQTFTENPGIFLLFALLLLKPLATCACLGSGAPGGLFTPTLCVGALLGSLLGHAWTGLTASAFDGSYAIIGAGALLAAATQGPVSALVMMVELTHQLNLLVLPLLLAISGAVVTARAVEARSIYSGRIHLGREAAEDDAATISAAAGYPEVLQALITLDEPERNLRVVDESGGEVGTIAASDLRDPNRLPPLREIATARDLASTLRP